MEANMELELDLHKLFNRFPIFHNQVPDTKKFFNMNKVREQDQSEQIKDDKFAYLLC